MRAGKGCEHGPVTCRGAICFTSTNRKEGALKNGQPRRKQSRTSERGGDSNLGVILFFLLVSLK